MSRTVIYTPVDSDQAVELTPKKTPLTELVRAANGGRDITRSAQLTLDKIRSDLVTSDSLEEFEAANENKGVFGWLERRRKRAANQPTRRADSVPILTAASVFATSRR